MSRITVSSLSPFEDRVGYSRAVRTGPLVGSPVEDRAAGHGPAAQTREALRRIEVALIEVGAALTDVIRTRMFVTDISRWEEIAGVHAEVFGDIRPVASMLEVSALIAPELLVEIEADAYVWESPPG